MFIVTDLVSNIKLLKWKILPYYQKLTGPNEKDR